MALNVKEKETGTGWFRSLFLYAIRHRKRDILEQAGVVSNGLFAYELVLAEYTKKVMDCCINTVEINL